MTFVRRRLPRCLLFALATILAAPGCDESTDPVRCEAGTAVICGYVTGPDGPVGAFLRAIGGPAAGGYVALETATDSTGWFEACVPVGSYRLECRAGLSRSFYFRRDGACWSSERADSVEAWSGRVRADFQLGALDLRVHLPDQLDGFRLQSVLTQRIGTAEFRLSDRTWTVAGESLLVSIPALPRGNYALALLPGGESGLWAWYPGTADPSAAESLAVTSGVTAEYAVAFPEPARIRGVVTGSWQTVISHRRPRLQAVSGIPSWSLRTTADSAGAFEFESLLPVPVRLYIDIGGVTRWMGGDSFEQATEVALVPGQTTTLDPYLESGILCRFSGSHPENLYRAAFQLTDPAGDIVVSFSTGCSGVDTVGVANLAPGDYYLKLTPTTCYPPQAWLPQWYDRADSMAAATLIHVTASGEALELTLHLVDGGRISGRLARSDGAFVDGHVMRLYTAADSLRSKADATADPVSGDFTFAGLPDGEYKLAVWTKGRAALWYPNTYGHATAEVLTIADHSSISGLEWIVEP